MPMSIWLFHIINNIVWICFNEASLVFDSLNHFLFSLKIFDWIKEGNFPFVYDVIQYVFPAYRWHGIFVGYLVAPFYFLFGRSENTGVFVNGTIFSGILIFSVYGICRKISQDKKTGILAAFIVIMYPLIFTHSRSFELDLPLTSMVALSIYFLLLSDCFYNRKFSLLFGLAAGLGMLTKFNFLGFISAPLFLVCFRVKKTGWINIAISLLLAIVISLKFYILKSREVFYRAYTTSWLCAIGYYDSQSQQLPAIWFKTALEYVIWFSREIISNSVSFLFMVVFAIASIPFITSKVKYKKIISLWLLMPLLFLSFVFHKAYINRYIMPLLPAMAIVSAAGIMNIANRKIKKILILSTVIFGLFQYLAISFKFDFLPEKIEISFPFLKRIALFNRSINLVHRNTILPFSYPASISWKEKEILDTIEAHSDGLRYINILFVDAIPEVYQPLNSRIAIERAPIFVSFIPLSDDFYMNQVDPAYLLSLADYVAIKKDNLKSNIWQNRLYVKESARKDIAETRRLFYNSQDKFALLKEINLPDPDVTILHLYKKKNTYMPN